MIAQRLWLGYMDRLWRRSDRSRGLERCKENIFVNHKRMRVFYSGRVQGVGFRYAAKRVATGFEITGTVRNLLDGRVELVAEGSSDELEAFRAGIRDSGLENFIRKEEVHWSESAHEFRGFEIVR